MKQVCRSAQVKSRRVGNSVVVTMPNGTPNLPYDVTITLGGTYIYTPMVKRTIKPSALEHLNNVLSDYIVPEDTDPVDDRRTNGK